MTRQNCFSRYIQMFDFHLSTDEVFFCDVWRNGSCVTFHIGIYRIDFSCPLLHYRGLTKGQRQGGYAPLAWRNRDPTGS